MILSNLHIFLLKILTLIKNYWFLKSRVSHYLSLNYLLKVIFLFISWNLFDCTFLHNLNWNSLLFISVSKLLINKVHNVTQNLRIFWFLYIHFKKFYSTLFKLWGHHNESFINVWWSERKRISTILILNLYPTRCYSYSIFNFFFQFFIC